MPSSRRRRCATLAAAATVSLAALAAPTANAADAAGCDLYASPSGSDLALGTAASPLRTVGMLVIKTLPGQTGCVKSGVYDEAVTVRRGGTADTSRLTIRGLTPGTATIRGQLRVMDGASFVTFSDLVLTGSDAPSKPSPLINGDDAQFLRNDVTNAQDSCFVLGDKVWGVPERTLISANVIHNCGVEGTNMQHGIYVRQALDTRIDSNTIRDNADRGVQLFPNADRTLVTGNLIDHNGEGVIFSGDSVDTSDNNTVENNTIIRSRIRWDVESYWINSGMRGTGNVLRGNCIAGGLRGAIQLPAYGFTATNNTLPPDPASCLTTKKTAKAKAAKNTSKAKKAHKTKKHRAAKRHASKRRHHH